MQWSLSEVDFSSKSLEEIAAFLVRQFPDQGRRFTADYLHWQYLENPSGLAIAINCRRPTGELVGHFANLPIESLVFKQTEKGLLSVNLAVDSSCRGAGIFVQMAHTCFNRAKASAFGHVILAANQNSTHGFIPRLGFQLIAPLAVRLGKTSPLEFNDRKIESFDFAPSWSEERRAWRLKSPFQKFSQDRASGRLLAMHYGSLLPIQVESTWPISRNPTLSIKSSVLSAYVGYDPRIRWSFGSSLGLPDWLKPSPLNFSILDLSPNPKKFLADRCLANAIDFDGF